MSWSSDRSLLRLRQARRMSGHGRRGDRFQIRAIEGIRGALKGPNNVSPSGPGLSISPYIIQSFPPVTAPQGNGELYASRHEKALEVDNKKKLLLFTRQRFLEEWSLEQGSRFQTHQIQYHDCLYTVQMYLNCL